MHNTVSQPIALRLKEAGWEWETYFVWRQSHDPEHPEWHLTAWKDHEECEWLCGNWLHAPNISEIRERLTLADFRLYYKVALNHGFAVNDWYSFAEWLFTVTASADELAEVWIWTTQQRTSQASGTGPASGSATP